MSLTRTHIAFLCIISIFTGIVGPGTTTTTEGLSYLMTNMRLAAYAILIVLIIAFSAASMRKWSLYKKCIILILIGLGFLLISTLTGQVESTKSLAPAHGVSWGWIFFTVGIILSIWSFRDIRSPEDSGTFSDGIDTIIGMVGGFALASIAIILMFSSLSFFSGGQNHNILSRMYGTGELQSITGGVWSYGDFEDMPDIEYNRSRDELLFWSDTSTGVSWEWKKGEKKTTGIIKRGQIPLVRGERLYAVTASGQVYSGGVLLLGAKVSLGEKAIIWKDKGVASIIHATGEYNFAYTGMMRSPIVLSENKNVLMWSEEKEKNTIIKKNNEIVSQISGKVLSLEMSPSGQNFTILIEGTGGLEVIKNNNLRFSLPKEYLSGSYRSNGSHFAYITKVGNIYKVYHDMVGVSQDLEEIRELFLEQEGGSYAYFGRPIGGKKYCLFTRYKKNICELEGYMNPRLGADGGSIIFAGKRNGIWSLYRNTDVIVGNTQYEKSDIRYDYVFFDTTNPRSYLFIERNAEGTYQYRKNGVLLPQKWKDISLDVYFGYDSHLITVAKNEDGWTILEL